VIRHPDGVVLFDVGCSENWIAEWSKTGISELVPYDDWTPEQRLEPMLSRIGLRVSDIDVVIASHLHMDHCGKLALFAGTGIDIVLQQAEFDGAMAIEPPGLAAYVTSQYRNLDVSWRLIDGDLDLMQGVRILSLPGHSFGTQGVAIRLNDSGLFVLASDAAHVRASLAEPPIGSPNTYDTLSWRRSIRRLQRMRDEQGATIVCGHEPAQLNELKLSPEYYT
jgi:glyoxylase-like metal-dependent hydrolase (beta-lactamase superfamily II)